jgi:hypothetical protein
MLRPTSVPTTSSHTFFALTTSPLPNPVDFEMEILASSVNRLYTSCRPKTGYSQMPDSRVVRV